MCTPFVRSFLHMHDEQLHAVIIAYMRIHYDIISEPDAFTALVFALQREITVGFHYREAWDVALIREVLMHHEIESHTLHNMESIRQCTVPLALHHHLKELGLHIVWIEWIGKWKNRMKLLYAKHSPLHWIHQKGVTFKCFDQQRIDKLFFVKQTEYSLPSINQ
jgi:hypothetical protein